MDKYIDARYIDADSIKWEDVEDEYGKRTDAVVACKIAVEQTPTADVVPKDVYDQIKWERDMALDTLREHGLELGERVEKEVNNG